MRWPWRKKGKKMSVLAAEQSLQRATNAQEEVEQKSEELEPTLRRLRRVAQENAIAAQVYESIRRAT